MFSAVTPVGAEMPSAPIGTNNGTGVPGGFPSPMPGAPQGKLSPQQVDSVVKQLNEVAGLISTMLSFSVDQPTGKTVIRVMNAETKEVIRQIPPEEMLRVAARIKDLLGVLFDETR